MTRLLLIILLYLHKGIYLKILKLFTNDVFLFVLNMIILVFGYIYFVNYDFNIFIEIMLIGMAYYIVSFITTAVVIFLIYFKIKSVFKQSTKNSIAKNLVITSFIFSEYFDEINSVKDFELKLKDIY